MIKSKPISMIQEGKQLSAIRLSICYSYGTGGSHDGGTDAAWVNVYGINKNGTGSNLISTTPLITNMDYNAGEYASQIITGIPVKDYPYIYWAIDRGISTFERIHAEPQLFVDVFEMPDLGNPDYITRAIQ